jgi:hypothetical protein
MLPNLSRLTCHVGAPAANAVGSPTWSAAKGFDFIDKVQAALTRKKMKFTTNDEIFVHVMQYLTGTFVLHPDLSDRNRNKVLWSTAIFIENYLADWGLSGGFWVGNTRFANNNVENLRDHRKEAFELFQRTLDYLDKSAKTPQAPVPQAPVPYKQRVAFLYVVVDKLGFLKKEVPQRHLFLIGHVKPNNAVRHWGVPGGLYDAADKSSLVNAMREFGEEVLGKKNLDTRAVMNLVGIANSIGTLTKFKQNGNYTAWKLLVNSALKFEMAFGLPKRTIQEKYQAPLSNETKGYLYVPFPLQVSEDKDNRTIVQAPSALSSRPLILRQGVLGPSKEI